VLYFALPCMLYRFGAGTPIAQLLDASLVAVYLPCALLMVAGTVVLSAERPHPLERRLLRRAGGGLSQHRLHGRAAAGGAAGAEAAGPAIVTILVDLLVTSSLCIALSRLDGADEHGAAVAARKALQGRGAQPDALGHRAGRAVVRRSAWHCPGR
jgi:malonate transporter